MADKAKRAARGDVLRIAVAIETDEQGGRPEEVAAYAFTNGGALIGSAPVTENGTADIKLPASDEARGARVLVGPAMEKPGLPELLRRGAVERHIRIDPGELRPVELTITPAIWHCWLLSRCTVRGTLLKRTERDGQPLELPVCGATVEIYEVDPISLLIPKLPDLVLEKIRDLLREPRIPIPLPEPLPDPFPDPFPRGPEPGPFPPGPGPDPAPFSGGEMRARSAPLPMAMREAAASGSLSVLRQSLIAHPELSRILICRFWGPVSKTLIGTATTDDCGHFTYSFFRGCANPDQPDLYFRATQRLWIFDIPIYEPTPVGCHTHWNYKCGTEVRLYTTSPFARTCAPCPPVIAGDDWVLVMHVGNLAVSNIRGVAQDLAATTTAANRGLLADGRPFGGTLRPHLEFDPSLRARGVRFYRVSVRRQGAAAFVPLDGQADRHFIYDNGGNPVIETFHLGPKYLPSITEPFFEIPPDVPPQGTWTTADAVQDITNAVFPSKDHAPGSPASSADQAGKFELRIELFDASGSPASGLNWVVPKEKNLAGASVIHTEAPAAGVVQGDAFILTLHVDNNACEASTDAPTLNSSPASDHCGVIRYTPPHGSAGTVVLPYRAFHRNGFASHSFTVKRGVTVLAPPSIGGAAVGGGTFAPSESVQTLMSQGLPPGSPPCEIGAFLEDVRVHAQATDGWGRRSEYDAAASRAFTLAPQP